ncbi:hypothetical protein GQ457_10G011220 [Hibiscus cannabinus]
MIYERPCHLFHKLNCVRSPVLKSILDHIVSVHTLTTVDLAAFLDRYAFVNLLASVDLSVLVDSSVPRGPPVTTDPSSVHGYGLVTSARGALIFSSEPRYFRVFYRPDKRTHMTMMSTSGSTHVSPSTLIASRYVLSDSMPLPICVVCEKHIGYGC